MIKSSPLMTGVIAVMLIAGIFYLLGSVDQKSDKKQPGYWKGYSQQALNEAFSHHQPVILDFFAQWCPGCHELDRRVFSVPAIQAQLSQVTALRVDATNINSSSVQEVIDRYQVVGIPTVVFLDGEGHEIKSARIEGVVSLKYFETSINEWSKQTGIHFK